ncbi:hypothetical protein BDV96DRAFT_654940 [Lophiotrema nucula]|uniref:Uncharacterized protein n=1 Tax=Lophiotrema nucula TaxID=690887 RepID=A0A6A5YGY8_9PLEO|nr:hypothetical protein BDV96DRAFT_654940 [Lophiotrema nucula]
MRVGTIDIVASDLAEMIKQRIQAPKRVPRVPNCTHINMDRIYDPNQHCYICGRFPAIGFLYECRSEEASTMQARESISKSKLQSELKEIGLSGSVIAAAERGEYTALQLEKLKAQKLTMRLIISETIEGHQANSAFTKLSSLATGPTNTDGTSSSKEEEFPPRCTFKACHTCRPYYRDRIYLSFDTVFTSPPAPLTREDSEKLPTRNANVLKRIGLLPSPVSPDEASTPGMEPGLTDVSTSSDLRSSGASVLTFKTTQSDMDEISQIRRPRKRFYNLGSKDSGQIARELNGMGTLRYCLKTAIHGIFRPSRDSSSSGSNITLPLPRTGTLRNLAQGTREFDIGSLRRVRRQKERADLRNGTLAHSSFGERRRRPSDMDGDNDSTSDFSVYSCASEGSEVEVDGGVALTEEAVGTHTPDILRVPPPSLADVAAEDDEEMDIGLQSIMTQV